MDILGMLKDVWPYLAALITALIGLYLAVSTRNKNNADAAESLSVAAKNLVETQLERTKRAELEKSEAEAYIAYLLFGVSKLTRQVQSQGIKPAFVAKTYSAYKKTHR